MAPHMASTTSWSWARVCLYVVPRNAQCVVCSAMRQQRSLSIAAAVMLWKGMSRTMLNNHNTPATSRLCYGSGSMSGVSRLRMGMGVLWQI